MFLVLRRLRELPPPADDLAQDLTDACFDYLELGFRNGGVSDIAVPKRMKKIGQMFYGRLQAYGAALPEADPAALEEPCAATPRHRPTRPARGLSARGAGASFRIRPRLHSGEATLFPTFCGKEPLHEA